MTNQNMSNGRTTSMTSERLQEILESYGGAPAVWPEGERNAARTLIETSSHARALQEAALGLDGIMDELTPPAPSNELVARLEKAGRRRAWSSAATPSKRAGWLRMVPRPFGPQQWAPAALSLAGVVLIAMSVFLINRGDDDNQAPKPVAIASSASAPAQDYLANIPLVDAESTGFPADNGAVGEDGFTVVISAQQSAFASNDDADALSDPWIELLADGGRQTGFRVSAASLSELPLE